MEQVAILTTGGTISFTTNDGKAQPTEKGEKLIQAVPKLKNYAEITVEEVFHVGSKDMTPKLITELGRKIKALSNKVDGVVVIHGTDTMEETAYYLDLTLNIEIPTILTGAQRRPDEVSPDGPANILSAIKTATNERFREGGGVYITFNEEVHAARDVMKTHSYKLEAFSSPSTGPIASITKDRVRIIREPKSYSDNLVLLEPSKTIVMVKSGVGVGGSLITENIDRADGFVVEATGVGNTTTEMGDAIGDAIEDGIPVVITSRCSAGGVHPIYGTRGGSKDLEEQGALFSGDLPAHKARLKLMLALETNSEGGGVEVFTRERDENV